MMSQLGYRRIRIRMSQQIVDVPIPVAIARVEGGTAEYVKEDEPKKPEVKSEQPKVETAAINTATEHAASTEKPVIRTVNPAQQQQKHNRTGVR